ncbi:MGH1-like glycoside hydrolase domain-containing protein [Oryzibacter oryziterrae]|uniref:MGH1-like glycoside hydrolase domain-containing protein n=1 Tax=Oryzibacter oryziterrae TaxID=2766474 RepID=UPI001F38F874|nr:hypothetical protein [Oryzibacter oryziterrae]
MSELSVAFPPHPLEACAPDTVRVRLTTSGNGARTFDMSTTAPQREGAPQERQLSDKPGDLRTLTGSLLLDALFTQAIDDARLNAVSSIRDGAYRYGEPIPCDCFQTGEKWTYVWTRDVSYATDLGIALVDPERAATSLLYKVSAFRPGVTPPEGLPADSLQIIQDTGSGGSWPVSTDRVSWAIGAERLLTMLGGEARRSFAATAYLALRGTLEADREAVFDPADGLYGGEQSFLDWRTQTYAPYVVHDLTEIARAKALSTNVCHYRALRLAARLAREHAEPAVATRYDGWAEALKSAINTVFWLPEHNLYASLTTPDSPARAIAKFDLLGLALAILSGIADGARARAILAAYPQALFGPSVVYPQQPDTFVYHNRAIWAFVTAYGLEAAARVGAVAAADAAFASLTRAAALALDNVENQEWLTGRTWYDDGPAISSRRQLWSIGGYVGMVARVLFGFAPDDTSLNLTPFLTAAMRAALPEDSALLEGLIWRGKRLSIRLQLPPASALSGHYPLAEIHLNGAVVSGPIAEQDLLADNLIEVHFGPLIPATDAIRLVPQVPLASHDDPRVFSPHEPVITDLVITDGKVRLNFEGQIPQSGRRDKLVFTVLRDGQLAESDIDANVWFDPVPLQAGVGRSYRVIAAFPEGGNASHVSRPAIVEAGTVTAYGLAGLVVGPDGSLRVPGIEVADAGTYALDLTYANHHFHIQTGVTNAVKRLTIRDAAGATVASGIVQMPHLPPITRLNQSTSVTATLPAGRYEVEISDYFNMSYLVANETYISPGGMTGPLNTADMRSVNLRRVK